MNTTASEPRGPGRPRKEETRGQRRRRQGAIQSVGRLGVNPDLIDHSKYAYRWINDRPGRLVTKTEHDDWDFVENTGVKDDSTDMGSRVSIVVGTLPDGSPMRAYLCRKPKTYFEEDKAAAQARLDEQLQQLRRGHDRAGATQSDYVPHSGISGL